MKKLSEKAQFCKQKELFACSRTFLEVIYILRSHLNRPVIDHQGMARIRLPAISVRMQIQQRDVEKNDQEIRGEPGLPVEMFDLIVGQTQADSP